MDNIVAKRHLEIAIQAALIGGNEIMQVYISEDFGVESKSDDSPVTKADIAASNAITTILERTGIQIINEESTSINYDVRKDWKQVWIVDPLDGTKEFIKQNGEFTVNIALIEDNAPVIGAIYVPVTDTLYFGISNDASYVIQKVSVVVDSLEIEHLIKFAQKLPTVQEHDVFRVVASKSHLNTETEDFINKLKLKHAHLETVSVGSSLKFCIVASGRADIYPRFGPTCEWDIAAGDAIARGAGCSVTVAQTGELMTYNRENVLNPHFIVKRK